MADASFKLLHVLLTNTLHLLFLEKTASCNDILSIIFKLKTVLYIFFITNSSKDSRYSIFRKSFFTFPRNLLLVKVLVYACFF